MDAGSLRQQGIGIDLVLGCCEHPDGVLPAYARESYWRKPNPGMVLEAVQRLRLDPARSVFLGDQMRDMEAAKAGGIEWAFAVETRRRGRSDGQRRACGKYRKHFVPVGHVPVD